MPPLALAQPLKKVNGRAYVAVMKGLMTQGGLGNSWHVHLSVIALQGHEG